MVRNEDVEMTHLVLLTLEKITEKHLEGQKDESNALRQSILFLIGLLKEEQFPAASEFIKFLINDFKPITDHLKNNTHEFLDEHGLLAGHFKGHDIPWVYFHDDTIKSAENNLVNKNIKIPTKLVKNILIDKNFDHDPFEDWQTRDNRYVAYFDILGFSNLVQNYSDMSDLLNKLNNIISATSRMEKTELFSNKKFLDMKNFPTGQLKSFLFSDSIIVVTKDDSRQSDMLLEIFALSIMSHALGNNLLLRGAIAFGEITVNIEQSIVFGEPLINAYKLAESQCWSGISIHPSTEKNRESEFPLKPAPKDWKPMTIPYRVPLKNNKELDLQVLNWPEFFQGSEQDLTDILKISKKQILSEKTKINKYHFNTMKFFKHSSKRKSI